MDSIKRYFPMIFGLLLTANSIYAQNNDWEWIKTFGGKKADEIYSTCTDKSDNIYITGYFQDEIDIEGKHLFAEGNSDILIAKFDSRGNFCWAKQAGGNSTENLIITDYGKIIKVDNCGNILVAGIFSWNAKFDEIALTSEGNSDIFMAKYDPNGKVLWAKNFGSFDQDYLFNMDIDNIGNVFFTGILNGTLVSDLSNGQARDLDPGSSTFIAKFDPMGNLSWIKSEKGAAVNAFISINQNGNIFYGIDHRYSTIIDNVLVDPFVSVLIIDAEGKIINDNKFDSKYYNLLSSMLVKNDNFVNNSGKYAETSSYALKSITDSLQALQKYFRDIEAYDYFPSSNYILESSLPKGKNFITGIDDAFFSTDIFSTEVNITGTLLKPSGSWFNSYLSKQGYNGSTSDIILQMPALFKSIIPCYDQSIIIAGSCENSIGISNQLNPSGGFVDFFVGKLKSSHKCQPDIGIHEIDESLGYSLFPNPTNDDFTIDSKKIRNVDMIKMTDQKGNLVQSYTNCDLPYLVKVQDISAGTYNVAIILNSKVTTKKIIIQ